MIPVDLDITRAHEAHTLRVILRGKNNLTVRKIFRTHRHIALTISINGIVSRPRGTWKWQDAYAISTCQPSFSSRAKYWYWICARRGDKMSMPQLKRAGYDRTSMPSRHNTRVSKRDILAFLEGS